MDSTGPVATIRPHETCFKDFQEIQAWCKENKITFNSLINSFFPAINYTINNCIFTDAETGRIYMRCDWNDVMLRQSHKDR